MLCLPHLQPLSLFSTEHPPRPPLARRYARTRFLSVSLSPSLYLFHGVFPSLLRFYAPHIVVSLDVGELERLQTFASGFSFDGPFSRHDFAVITNSHTRWYKSSGQQLTAPAMGPALVSFVTRRFLRQFLQGNEIVVHPRPCQTVSGNYV